MTSAHPSLASIVGLLESVPAMLWETDARLRFTFIAGAALGIAPEAVQGCHVQDLFVPAASCVKIIEAHNAALHGDSSSFEMNWIGRDFQTTIKPLYGAGGVIQGVAGIALDMTERVIAERAFRLSEHSYRSLIEDAPYAICQATFAGELLQVNGPMAEMLGYDHASGAEVLLRDLPLVFTPAGTFEAFQQAVMQEGSRCGTESTWIRRDGRSIRVQVSGRVVRDRSGGISHLEIFAEDITDRKQLEAELGQAQKMQALGQLAGGIAHDFNNLLTVISGHVEMILADSPGDELRESLTAVRDAGRRAAALTEQMLAFSRRRTSRIETIDLNDLLRKLMSILSRLIREDIELRLIAPSAPAPVTADPHEIERVILNLAVNAQDAMPNGGKLTIESSGGEYLEISVRDTGTGMDRVTQARVFEPFFTTKDPGKGTGLGLSVVYGIVRRIGGQIRLESEPGQGTTFRIFFPHADAPPLPGQPVTALKSALPRGSETILFAEDDPAIRKLMAPFLEGLGYQVLSAPDGREAWRVAQDFPGPIQLLLSDVVMPGLGGRELLTRLRQTSRPDLNVLFISGYTGERDATAERAGPEAEDGKVTGVHFLQKPFSLDLLATAVREVLDAPALTKAAGD